MINNGFRSRSMSQTFTRYGIKYSHRIISRSWNVLPKSLAQRPLVHHSRTTLNIPFCSYLLGDSKTYKLPVFTLPTFLNFLPNSRSSPIVSFSLKPFTFLNADFLTNKQPPLVDSEGKNLVKKLAGSTKSK